MPKEAAAHVLVHLAEKQNPVLFFSSVLWCSDASSSSRPNLKQNKVFLKFNWYLNPLTCGLQCVPAANDCIEGQKTLCIHTLETVQFGISRSAGPEGRYCKTTNRKCTMSQTEQKLEPLLSHQNKLHNLTNTHSPWQHTHCWRVWSSSARKEWNCSTIPSQTGCPVRHLTESFDLAVQIADSFTSAKVCLDPCTSARCPLT